MSDALVHLQLSFEVSRQGGRTGAFIRDWFDLSWRDFGGPLRVAAMSDDPFGPTELFRDEVNRHPKTSLVPAR